MKKKLSLFMIATAAVVTALSLGIVDLSAGFTIIQDIFWGILIQLLTNKFVSIVRQKPKPVYAVLGFFAVLKSGCCHSFKSKNN
ncbi:TPA: hypothetical protein ACF48F_001093 [Streptococcus pyogenes]|uniref:hypothetical protein n=1 Tax=Streptococcus pyogenes TaxID=1314 RepID=UPI002B1CA37A|nr:hypothetical protein [Streptococcus pyogenes]HES2759453.1 hypothetical protein [Streptococcus pyogenes]